MSKGSVIKRCTKPTIKREKSPYKVRDENEVAYASTMGRKPHERKSLYKDIYEYYESNEV